MYQGTIGTLADRCVRSNLSAGSLLPQLAGRHRPVNLVADLKEPVSVAHENHLSSWSDRSLARCCERREAYGDAYPVTLGGKIFTGFILILGLGIVAVPTGLLASALTKTKPE